MPFEDTARVQPQPGEWRIGYIVPADRDSASIVRGARLGAEEATRAGDLIGVQQSGLPQFRIADLETQVNLMRMAQNDSRLLLERDPDLTSPRGQAMRTLLWLMGRDQAIHMLSVG